MDAIQGILRWIHIIAGITWIGLLYFFNFVNSAFAPTMDGETKKKVVPELMPRALYWFRWGAAYTWITGVLLVLVVFYHGDITLESGNTWGVGGFVMIGVTFLGVVVYDLLASSVMKPLNAAFAGGVVLSAVILILLQTWAGFSGRGMAIHLAALFGTCMAYNVWMRIWPAQKRIITATKNGEAPNPDDAALAGLRSKHNTYMSVPLVFMMVNPHEMTWLPGGWLGLTAVVIIG